MRPVDVRISSVASRPARGPGVGSEALITLAIAGAPVRRMWAAVRRSISRRAAGRIPASEQRAGGHRESPRPQARVAATRGEACAASGRPSDAEGQEAHELASHHPDAQAQAPPEGRATDGGRTALCDRHDGALVSHNRTLDRSNAVRVSGK